GADGLWLHQAQRPQGPSLGLCREKAKGSARAGYPVLRADTLAFVETSGLREVRDGRTRDGSRSPSNRRGVSRTPRDRPLDEWRRALPEGPLARAEQPSRILRDCT